VAESLAPNEAIASDQQGVSTCYNLVAYEAAVKTGSKRSEVQVDPAASTGRRNRSAEQLRWFHPSKGLSRAVVALASHRSEFGS
jgi:hypothetical protein